jgi:aquaporin Z
VVKVLTLHWQEYLMEAWGLGVFMVSAGAFATLLEAEWSPFRRWLPSLFSRRALMGLAMGGTALGIFLSPWGQRSGAHINPAVTLSFWLLGKVSGWDAGFYALFQLLGGLAGVLLVRALAGAAFARPPVAWVATVPGKAGPGAAFLAELLMAFGMMAMVLFTPQQPSLRAYTPHLAALLVCLYITFESPLSGMSINPARTLASALPGRQFRNLWIYLAAPPMGMALATLAYLAWMGPGRSAAQATMHPEAGQRCVFANPSCP